MSELAATTSLIVHDATRAIEQAKQLYNVVLELRKEVLNEGVDYGVIPGTGKPTLFKPGAERLCWALGLSPEFEAIDTVERWDDEDALFHYRYRCNLRHIDSGKIIATGIGSCNSKESKYRWRRARIVCPSCDREGSINRSNYPPRGKPDAPNGWYCRDCKAQFEYEDEAIAGQELGRVENDDIFSIVNTIDKMAQKRALIAAVLIGANASEFFTQDIEDMPGFEISTPAQPQDTPKDKVIEGQFTEQPKQTSQNGAAQPEEAEQSGETEIVQSVMTKISKDGRPYMIFDGVTLWSREPLRQLSYTPMDIEPLAQRGVSELPDGVIVKWERDENGYKRPVSIKRAKTGEIVRMAELQESKSETSTSSPDTKPDTSTASSSNIKTETSSGTTKTKQEIEDDIPF